MPAVLMETEPERPLFVPGERLWPGRASTRHCAWSGLTVMSPVVPLISELLSFATLMERLGPTSAEPSPARRRLMPSVKTCTPLSAALNW